MPTTTTGKYVMCSRCHGTGEARYNHLNGDTHCYLCGGVGMVYRASAAEKAREAQEQAWRQATYNALHVGHGYLQQLRRPVRQACQQVPWPTEGRRAPQAELDAYEADQQGARDRAARMTRALTYWVQGDDYEAAVDAAPAARAAARQALLRTTLADPTVQRRMAQARVAQLERDAAAAAQAGTTEVRGMGVAGVQDELARARTALAQVAA